jgi:hypothetical protein
MAALGTAGLDEMIADYEVARRKLPYAARDIHVYRAAARLYAQNQDWARAEPAYRRAVTAVSAIVNAWPDRSEQIWFLARHSALLDEARHCLGMLNKSEEAQRLIPVVQSAEEFQQRLADAPRLRHRRLLRAGLWILLVNIICIACQIAFVALVADQRGGFMLLVAPLLFVLYTSLTALYLLFHAAIGRFIPGLRHSGGAVILILACMPWLSLLFIPLFLLLDLAR